jgi:selenocysteine lyase/cysteine desulfurase
LMKHLGLKMESGVVRASLLHYNTIDEIREFGKILSKLANA